MAKSLFWIILILTIFGLVVLTSAGIIDAQKKFDSPYYYLYHQLLWAVLPGFIFMFVLSKINYKIWKKLSLLVLFVALGLMALVFVPQFSHGLKGAVRWLDFRGIVFQPAELLKLALVIYLAAWFSGRDERIKNWVYGMAPFFVVLAFAGILLAMQPDIGTLIIVSLISLGVYFLAGVNWKQFSMVILILVLAVVALTIVEPYRFDRIKTFLNPSADPRGSSYQINQSLISIGSGGVFGVGYGKSTQKFGFLPEVVGDSIFAVLAEELGLIGSVATILFFLALSFILLRIAQNTHDQFGALFVMGMNIWITAQAFVNIAAITGLLPLTGIPLPFISYGGTATIALLSGLGIVFNIARS